MGYDYYDISQYARSTDLSAAASAGVGALIGSMIGMYFIIILIIAVLQIIANWKLFTKAGESGWKSIIPIYNLVILFKISGLSPWLILAYLATVIPVVGWIVLLVISIFQVRGLAKAFGRSTPFAIGLLLVPTIFYMILGFDSSTYIGNNSKKDVIDEQ